MDGFYVLSIILFYICAFGGVNVGVLVYTIFIFLAWLCWKLYYYLVKELTYNSYAKKWAIMLISSILVYVFSYKFILYVDEGRHFRIEASTLYLIFWRSRSILISSYFVAFLSSYKLSQNNKRIRETIKAIFYVIPFGLFCVFLIMYIPKTYVERATYINKDTIQNLETPFETKYMGFHWSQILGVGNAVYYNTEIRSYNFV